MAAARPGATLRPHVKAHKCTALAAAQAAHGHTTFTCATPREVAGMAAAGLGADLLLANEVLDVRRLRDMVAACHEHGAQVTVAVDSAETVDAAASAGVANVLVDVNVGLPLWVPSGARRPDRRPGPPLGDDGARRDGLRGPPDDGARPGRTAGEGGRGDGPPVRRTRRGRRGPGQRRRHRHLRPPPSGGRGPSRQLRADGHRLRPTRPAVRAGVLGDRHGRQRHTEVRGGGRGVEGNGDRPRQPDRRTARRPGRGRVVPQRRARHVHPAHRHRRSRSAGA